MSFLEEKKPDVLQYKEGRKEPPNEARKDPRTTAERRNKDIEIEGTEE